MMRIFMGLCALLVLAPGLLLSGCGGATVTTDQTVTATAGGMTLDAGTSSGAADGYVYVPTMGLSRQPIIISPDPEPPDAQHMAAVGAQVTCSPLVGGGSRQVDSTTTDGAGYYLFTDLAPGYYQITVTVGEQSLTIDIVVQAGYVTHANLAPTVGYFAGFRAIFVDLTTLEAWPEIRPYLMDVNWMRLGFTSNNPDGAFTLNVYMSARGDLRPEQLATAADTVRLIRDLGVPTGTHTFALGDLSISMTQEIKDLIFAGRFWLYGVVTPAASANVTISSIQVQMNLKVGQEVL